MIEHPHRRIIVVNYGLGNVGSICNMIRKIGYAPILTSDWKEMLDATHIILPGVGSFDTGMKNLESLDLVGPLTALVMEKRVSTLGICLGMQLLGESSEEGEKPGLGWIHARSKKFVLDSDQYKIPHVGWNSVRTAAQEALFRGLHEANKFYFVHSYRVECDSAEDVVGVTNYGGEFVSSFRSGNVTGVQFHPEKSHKYGMMLFRNFITADVEEFADGVANV